MLMLYFQDFVNVLKLFIRNLLNMELGSLQLFFFFFFNWQVVFS